MSGTAGKRGFGEFKRALAPGFADYVRRRSGRFMELEGHEMAFTIDKTRLEESTFSAEALDGMCEQFRSWIWSRVGREYKATGKPPHHLKVYVVVSMGDEPQKREFTGEDAHDWKGEGP